MQPHWQEELALQTGLLIQSCQSVSGGDISDAYLLETDSGHYFLKTNPADDALLMFQLEQVGLEALDQHPSIRIPRVLGTYQFSGQAGILMEYIESKRPNDADWRLFGRSLAELHRETQAQFGWEQDNFIGRLPQSNHRHDTWTGFYAAERLSPQIELARTKGLLSPAECPNLSELKAGLEPYCEATKPSLLHGDLWSGNFLFDTSGQPCLIDPATYFGHYEVDLAMTRLFGGFRAAFYEAYAEIQPATAGIEQRNELYQLYYLLVHLNLFGRSYYTSVKKLLDRYF